MTYSFGNRFKEKLLAEEDSQKNELDNELDNEEGDDISDDEDVKSKLEKQSDALLKSFPTTQQKVIVTLMLLLGAPVASLKLYKSTLRKSVIEPANLYRKNSAFRIWANKLVKELSAPSVTEEVDDDKFGKQLTNKYQHLIFEILKALGLPEAVERTSSRLLRSNIRAKALELTQNSHLRLYIKSVAQQLGIDTVDSDNNAEPVEESKLTEESTTQETTDIINDLLVTLGFDLTRNTSLLVQEKRQAVRKMLLKLAANQTLVKRLKFALDLIKDKFDGFKADETNAEDDELIKSMASENVEVKKSKLKEENDKWNIATLANKGILLKSNNVTIELNKDEANDLSSSLSRNKSFKIKQSNDKSFTFTPKRNGEIVVTDDETDINLTIDKKQANILKSIMN